MVSIWHLGAAHILRRGLRRVRMTCGRGDRGGHGNGTGPGVASAIARKRAREGLVPKRLTAGLFLGGEARISHIPAVWMSFTVSPEFSLGGIDLAPAQFMCNSSLLHAFQKQSVSNTPKSNSKSSKSRHDKISILGKNNLEGTHTAALWNDVLIIKSVYSWTGVRAIPEVWLLVHSSVHGRRARFVLPNHPGYIFSTATHANTGSLL